MTVDHAVGWPVLSVVERRVLGVLVEKQKTTDTYPLSLNAVTVGSNQKSNRDPLLNLDDVQVEEALTAVQKKGLVMRLISGRVDKWKHTLYDVWKVSSVEIAVIAELLLRGPQTVGDLRGRASRMKDIADLDQLKSVLRSLQDRKLVVYLTDEDRRGAIITHGFHAQEELDHLARAARENATHFDTLAAPSLPGASGSNSLRSDADWKELLQRVSAVEERLDRLHEVVTKLQSDLGATGNSG
jgi:uncharacterized protein YceH (UPF0502 family)